MGGRMIWAGMRDVSSFNPILVEDVASRNISNLIFNGLLQLDHRLELVPALAEEFGRSKDGTEWTFRVRDDVYWHDGKKLTAEDVEFTYLAVMHPAYTGGQTENFRPLEGAGDYLEARAELSRRLSERKMSEQEYRERASALFEEWRSKGAIRADGEREIRFVLEKPNAPFENYLTLRVLPKHLLTFEAAGDRKHPFNTHEPVGTGPFKLAGRVRGAHVTLKRNERYFGEGPYLDTVVYRIMSDRRAITRALESGEVDYGRVLPTISAGPSGSVRLLEYPTLTYTYMGYNLANPLFQDKRVRQAIAHAVDRRAIVRESVWGFATVAHSHGSPLMWDYNPDVPKFEFDPDKSRKLLAEAGWEDVDGDGVLERDGKKFSFLLQTDKGCLAREEAAAAIKKQLANVGIEVEVELVEWDRFVNDVLRARKFDAAISAWDVQNDPDPDVAYEIWHTGGSLNFTSFSDKRIDKIYEAGRVTMNRENRKALYQEAQEILAEEQPYLFLFFPADIQGVSKRLDGPIARTPIGPHWNLELWRIVGRDKGSC